VAADSVNPSHAYVHLESVDTPVIAHGVDRASRWSQPCWPARRPRRSGCPPDSGGGRADREQYLIAASRRPDYW